MVCPVCGKKHRDYPIVCIRKVEARMTYRMLGGKEIPEDLKKLYAKVKRYDEYWMKKE